MYTAFICVSSRKVSSCRKTLLLNNPCIAERIKNLVAVNKGIRSNDFLYCFFFTKVIRIGRRNFLYSVLNALQRNDVSNEVNK